MSLYIDIQLHHAVHEVYAIALLLDGRDEAAQILAVECDLFAEDLRWKIIETPIRTASDRQLLLGFLEELRVSEKVDGVSYAAEIAELTRRLATSRKVVVREKRPPHRAKGLPFLPTAATMNRLQPVQGAD